MLTDRRPILLANARVIDPSRDIDGPGDVLIADGVIRDLKRGIGAAGVPEGTDVVNCAGKIVAPGLIDMCAFVGEPGLGHRETFASASQAAATGGITTIICQPGTEPVIDNSATVDFVLRRARDTAIVNIQPMAALTKGLRATLFQDIGEPQTGDIAPYTVHWCLGQPVFPHDQLGPDGHPTRGGFLPPVPLPRRMWVGGEVQFIDPLRVGDVATRVSTITDVSLKSGSTGQLCFVAVEHVVSTPRGTAIRERQDIVYRDMGGAQPASPKAPPPPVAQHSESHVSDPVL
ncbi:MAG: MaoC family dehydratase N-terminal domain-containing protein, partial [Bradyrhizobium sp.]|nr:MaoC family dehydratase N-terminal domain-containing protein [Bradyrhizobium sp.]